MELGAVADVEAEEDDTADLAAPHAAEQGGRRSDAPHCDDEALAHQLADGRLRCRGGGRRRRDGDRGEEHEPDGRYHSDRLDPPAATSISPTHLDESASFGVP